MAIVIHIPKVSINGSVYENEESSDMLELQDDRIFKVVSPVRYSLRADVVSKELIVQGVAQVDLECLCSRCADFFSTTVYVSSFLRAYEITEGLEVVDLTPDLREELLIEIPHFPVCRPDCKGLCPHCGKDLNEGPCACHPEVAKAWTALDALAGLQIKPTGEPGRER